MCHPSNLKLKFLKFKKCIALELVVPFRPPRLVSLRPRLDFVGLVWWIFIILNFYRFLRKKGEPKTQVGDQNKRRGTETGIDTIVYGPKETSSAICLVVIAFLILPRSNFVGSKLFIGNYSI